MLLLLDLLLQVEVALHHGVRLLTTLLGLLHLLHLLESCHLCWIHATSIHEVGVAHLLPTHLSLHVLLLLHVLLVALSELRLLHRTHHAWVLLHAQHLLLEHLLLLHLHLRGLPVDHSVHGLHLLNALTLLRCRHLRCQHITLLHIVGISLALIAHEHCRAHIRSHWLPLGHHCWRWACLAHPRRWHGSGDRRAMCHLRSCVWYAGCVGWMALLAAPS